MDTTQRATAWSVTINNPTPQDEECIAMARQKGWSVEGQLERGDNGTPHYQLLVKTPQTRWSTFKKAFPRGHIEIARNVVALETYVHKEDTREGELKQTSELYPSLQKLWDMFADYYSPEMHEVNPETFKRKEILDIFDDFISVTIRKGYIVETMAVNPQIRSAIKNYYKSIIYRSNIRRQTDRQTGSDVAVEK